MHLATRSMISLVFIGNRAANMTTGKPQIDKYQRHKNFNFFGGAPIEKMLWSSRSLLL